MTDSEMYGLIIAATGVFFAILTYFKKQNSKQKKKVLKPIQIENGSTNNNNINITLPSTQHLTKNQPENQELDSNKSEKLSREDQIDLLKMRVQVLFIDDDIDFNIVQILKDNGWRKTKSIIDVKALDDQIIRDSQIYFVDINGIGKLMNCEHEGLDVALMLKQKYPEKKTIIYSANNKANSFHLAWDSIDHRLEKNALPYQFQSIVEKYALEFFKTE